MTAKLCKEFNAIRAALAPSDPEESHEGQDLEKARKLADAYVAAHPDEFSKYEGMELPELVAAVDVYRAAGMAHDMWHVDTWMLHKFEPQDIGGAGIQVRIRRHDEA